MTAITLDMTLSAASAHREWEEEESKSQPNPARKAALWRRYMQLRDCEARDGDPAKLMPVKYIETDNGTTFSRSAPAPTGRDGRNAEEGTARKSDTRKCAETISKSARPGDSRKDGTNQPAKKMKRKPEIDPWLYPAIHKRIGKALATLGYTPGKGGTMKGARQTCGISAASWHFAVNAGTQITRGILDKLSAALGIGREWLETGKGEMLVDGGKPNEKATSKPPPQPTPPKPRPTRAPAPPPAKAGEEDAGEVSGGQPMTGSEPPGSPLPSGAMCDLIAQLNEQCRALTAARVKIAALSRQILNAASH